MSGSPTNLPSCSTSARTDDVVEFIDPLVARAREGDTRAWSRLYDLLFGRVYRHASLLTGDTDLADDIAQETFARAMVHVGEFRGQARFTTWLHGIALNIARGHWRHERNTATAHRKLSVMTELRADPKRDAPDRAELSRRKAAAIYGALQQLPDTLRSAFILRELEGLSLREAAAQLEISENNVAVRSSRARNRLRDELARLGWFDLQRAKK
ncbi:MAG: RNA polymerase sigma factor [Nannocystaceae bacterium]